MVLPNLLSGERVAGGGHGGLPKGHEHPDQDREGKEEGAPLHLQHELLGHDSCSTEVSFV